MNGQESLVIPSVLLRETVLENSPNPKNPSKPVPHFIERKEIENSARLWDGERVTMFHPGQRNDVEGPRHRVKKAITSGKIREPHMEDDKLKGLVVCSVQRLESVRFGSVVKNNALDGQIIEGSTGYIADYVEAEPNAQYNGQAYKYTQHNIRPDHFAVLPFGKGKCSVKDGCGLNRNVQIQNVLETGRVPNFEGTTSDDWDRQNLSDAVDGFLSNVSTDLTEDDLNRNDWGANPQEFRSWAVQKSILGSADEDGYQRGTLWQVVNYNTENLNENALDAVISGRGEQTEGISEQTRVAGQGIARNLLKEEYDRDLPDEEETENMSEKVVRIFRDFVKKYVDRNIENDSDLDAECRQDVITRLSDLPVQPDSAEAWADLGDEDLLEVANSVGLEVGDDCCHSENALVRNGENLGNFIDERVEGMTGEGETIQSTLEDIADSADRAPDTIRNIMSGDIICPPVEVLEGIAQAIQVETSTLINEAEQDGCEYETENIQKEGTIMAELSDEQLEALSELEPDEIRAAGQMAKNAQSERQSLISDLVENDEAPFDEAEDLDGVQLNSLRKLHESFAEPTQNGDGGDGDGGEPVHVGNGGGGAGYTEAVANTDAPDPEELESLSSTPVVTGGPDE